MLMIIQGPGLCRPMLHIDEACRSPNSRNNDKLWTECEACDVKKCEPVRYLGPVFQWQQQQKDRPIELITAFDLEFWKCAGVTVRGWRTCS